MKKEQLENSKQLSSDLFQWIKYFLADKVGYLKIQESYHNEHKQATAEKLIYFERELWQLKVMNCKAAAELDKVSKQIKKNGMRSHGTYSVPLLRFYSYAAAVEHLKSIRDIDTNFIIEFIEHNLYSKSEWTCINYYNQIKSLFIFINKYAIRDDNLFFDVESTFIDKNAKSPIKKAPERTIKYLEPNDYVKLISSIESYENNHPNKKQPNFLAKVISLVGLSVNTVRDIKLSEVSIVTINREKYLQIYVNRKNSDCKYVYVHYKYIKDEYERELEFRKENNITTEYLFYTRAYTQYAEKTVYDLIRRYLIHAGITKSMNTGALRHSSAIYMLLSGISTEKVGRLLCCSENEMLSLRNFFVELSFKNIPELMKEILYIKKEVKKKRRTRNVKNNNS